jgi:diguanylate cyclase (GGDEF)-like protein
LADAGLAEDPSLVYHGNFLYDSGTEAIRVLIDERGKTFDAIVAANDVMAVWAAKELEKRGFSVPGDVSVVGYDDLEIARDQSPPLTTIRQPLDELMLRAFKAAQCAMCGECVSPGSRVLPVNIVYRRSCGCGPMDLMRLDAQSRRISERERSLLDAFLATLSFEEARTLLVEADSAGESTTEIFLRVSAMVAERGIDGDRRAEILAVLVTAATELRNIAERRVKDDEFNLRRIAGELLGFAGAERLGSGLRTVLKRAGLGWWLVSEYTSDRKQVRVVASSDESLLGRIYVPEAFIPEGDIPDSLIVLPLYLGDESLGFMAVSGIAERTAIIELLREHLSASILQMRNEERERHSTEELSRLVDERTGELRTALSELSEAHRLLEVQAISDEMTGLLNRRGFFTMVERELRLNGRKRSDLTLVFADIDGLKIVNDSWGHAAGDWLITSVAGILRKTFRETDIVARLGGDEFTVLATDCSPVEVDTVRQRMNGLLQELNASSGKSWKVMVSLGFAHSTEMDRDYTLSDLMQLADRRLYEEKMSRRTDREKGAITSVPG